MSFSQSSTKCIPVYKKWSSNRHEAAAPLVCKKIIEIYREIFKIEIERERDPGSAPKQCGRT
jgi:hypothetical protein